MKKIIFIFATISLIIGLSSCATSKNEGFDYPVDAVMRNVDKTTANSLNPDAIEAFNQGSVFLDEGNYLDAEFYLRMAIEYDDTYIDAYDYLGMVLRRLGETDEAIDILKKSINMDPINSVPYNSLAIAYMDKGDYKNALKTCDEAIKYIPDGPDGYYQKGMIYMNQEKYKDAVLYLEDAYSIYRKKSDKQFYEAACSLGICYYGMKNWSKSVRYLEIAMNGFPDDEKIKNYYESAKKNQ